MNQAATARCLTRECKETLLWRQIAGMRVCREVQTEEYVHRRYVYDVECPRCGHYLVDRTTGRRVTQVELEL
jgi:hypothetical protein